MSAFGLRAWTRLFLFIQVLLGNVVLRNFMRPYFAFVGVRNVFDAFYNFSFECVSFFEQFVNALGIRALAVRQTLQITGLAAGAGTKALGFEHDGVHAVALAAGSIFLECFLLFWSSLPGRRGFLCRLFLGHRLAARSLLLFGGLLLFVCFGWHGWSLPLTCGIARISSHGPGGRRRACKAP